jgi:signal transduction histidine kinase
MVTLEASKPFRNLSRGELNALQQIAQKKTFAAGTDIFREGDNGDGVYVVKDGLVDISVGVAQGTRRVFAQVGPGEMFGEMAVLEMKPRSATATAVRASTVYFIPRDELLVMVEHSPTLALELLREISQRLRVFDRRYLEEILQAERLAVVGRFARSIVHDLKNPLNIIGLTAELASTPDAAPEFRRKSATTIRKQVDRISELIGEILDFTQGTRADYVLASADYGAFVEQLLEEIRPEVELKGARLELEGPPPSVKLPLDPLRLRRVFQNLIHNATDAMPDGGKILVRLRLAEAELVTEIGDTGPGIAPEIAGKLFEVFATYGKAHGTGLGLSICRKIIEDHHGRIWARNQPAGGAMFSFALPVPKESLKG